MEKKIKVGILRETKNPPDKRVAVTPPQVIQILEQYPNVEIFVQPSDLRCYKDEEYKYLNIQLKEDLSDCDILIGVKEVEKSSLIPKKTYMFFSHVGKKQSYNRGLLQEIINKKIKLIDYEYLTNTDGSRIVAFGRWAGIVGAYNGLRARGIRTDSFSLKPANECKDMEEMFAGLKMVNLKPKKILVTGGGRVANGAMETLSVLNLKEVSPENFLNKKYDEAVVCRLDPGNYVKHRGGMDFNLQHFFKHPEEYISTFKKYTEVADIYMACHFWDPNSPVFITKEDMQKPEFNISVIADVSCDVNGPIASTLRSSTIADPFYGYNIKTKKEEPAFTSDKNITVMAVDNLPGELPRNSSADFCHKLLNDVFPFLLGNDDKKVIERGTITNNGKLTDKFNYLQDYIDGKE